MTKADRAAFGGEFGPIAHGQAMRFGYVNLKACENTLRGRIIVVMGV